MEEQNQKDIKGKNGITKLILKKDINITVLDLTKTSISDIDGIEFPSCLNELNLSYNELEYVPNSVLCLECLKVLNLSSNNIKYFDETPAFCHSIESLNLAYNELCGPPYWIWAKSPKNLIELDISGNVGIKKSLDVDYLSELLQYQTSLKIVKMQSCCINSKFELLETTRKVKVLDLSTTSLMSGNNISEVPCLGMEKCCDIERLNLSHTWLYHVRSNIDMFKNLIEINLSENNICSLPNEFCNLMNLEKCILSFNNITYLPNDIVKLKKLSALCVDSNNLWNLPENMQELSNLVKLDLYDNYLYDAQLEMDSIQELDLAQNYLDEPINEQYKERKRKLRLQTEDRLDERKYEIERPESMHSSSLIEEYSEDNISVEENNDDMNRTLSSPEDWDSDEYWVPHFPRPTRPPQSPWLFFVKKKMAEGNFCPMDLHPISISEKVKYEKLCNPSWPQECIGQFDDYSSDDS